MSHHLYLTLQSSIPHYGGKNFYVWISKPIHLYIYDTFVTTLFFLYVSQKGEA